jgi:hypothetical protein
MPQRHGRESITVSPLGKVILAVCRVVFKPGIFCS